MLNTKKPTIILGIDPGIADTGYGIIEQNGNKLTALAFGSIKTKKSTDLAERLLQISDEIEKLVDKFNPDIASVEKLFFCKNITTAMTVGQARGAIMLNLARKGIHIVEPTPLQVKQGVTGYGQADKKQVQKMVQAILSLEELPKQDDAADALAIAIGAIGQTGSLK